MSVVGDGGGERSGWERELGQMVKGLGKPVSVAVNKVDPALRQDLTSEFYRLGIADGFPVSGEHGTGTDARLDHVTEGFPKAEEPAGTVQEGMKVASIGGPDVGKSTLLDTLTGRE